MSITSQALIPLVMTNEVLHHSRQVQQSHLLKTALQNFGKFKQIQIEKEGLRANKGEPAGVWSRVRQLAKEDNPCYFTDRK